MLHSTDFTEDYSMFFYISIVLKKTFFGSFHKLQRNMYVISLLKSMLYEWLVFFHTLILLDFGFQNAV